MNCFAKRVKKLAYLFKTDTESVDWAQVAALLSHFGLSQLNAETQKRVFESSYAVVFVYDGETLIGCGRALSDGVCQAAIYNIALDERYHGQGLGKEIIRRLVSQVSECNIILYTHPKTVSLYEHLGFRRMKTGMAMYRQDHIEELEKMDFI